MTDALRRPLEVRFSSSGAKSERGEIGAISAVRGNWRDWGKGEI